MKASKRILFILVAIAGLVGGIGTVASSSGSAAEDTAPPWVQQKPSGYRDWKFVSVAHEEGNLHSLGAVLANDVAVKAYREKTIPFPDGSIIAALHYRHTASDENDKVFGQAQSFVAGEPTNVQFMVKDSKKYAATGGWGFGHFNADGKPVDAAFMKPCFPCHAQDQAHDLVFTQYAP
jgi:Cytochrome P460